ncbi:PstA family ABC transporter permease [Pseudothermotoga thermarum]|uniref:Binding-protein-dependent transport systems inner membrane component n=1 Tax=Pseudothermotoga thermarum DSM 5069 TaxID=688269 RepID=F7YXJ3_9THEM|nr:ABC transporter permease subunit [Pseudothermotoga thermarum]AEH50634.1 binding-protein-dependent transport systems inner membrane component [Pseudothermotoga thermarum DSM 5069]
MKWFLRVISYVVFAAVLSVIITITVPGIKHFFKPGFFTEFPKAGMTEGGIFPALIGSLLLICLVFAISIPLGLFATIFVAEFAPKRISWLLQNFSITMNGIPSIVYGLFGLSFFCVKLSLGTSLISASLTLTAMAVPFFISGAVEFLKAVPKELREGVLALGANRFDLTLMVLKASKSGLLTTLILTLGRAFSETAPILVTGAVFYAARLPGSLRDPVMTLPTSIYAIVMNLGERSQWMAQGMASLMTIVMIAIYSVVQMSRR